MDICFIIDNPATGGHPVLSRVISGLGRQHRIRLLDVNAITAEGALARELGGRQPAIYLLKSHAPQALELARGLEERRRFVVNSWESSSVCRDRVLMTERMRSAGLPWPRTWAVSRASHAFREIDDLTFPLIVKSRYSRRGDFVGRIESLEELQALGRERPDEPLILQEFVPGGGTDIKFWVIGGQVFAAGRPSPLAVDAVRKDSPIAADDVPASWRTVVLQIGRVFGLYLYGVDLLETPQGPVVIDVNAFPGFRGVPGADSALMGLIGRLAEGQAAVSAGALSAAT